MDEAVCLRLTPLCCNMPGPGVFDIITLTNTPKRIPRGGGAIVSCWNEQHQHYNKQHIAKNVALDDGFFIFELLSLIHI
ncbi:hypothetical protein [Paenibacillus sp. CECT 9249]|uniref:hypothetical protein n=1 Tax=Paenibacillus sp. CECT 9249 TaxID=2845385 RepID=UPI001E2DC7CA|nr:hypothetical protein [Paenibacillus sp. CECT 9249]